jgi:hypothetical protein
MTVHRAPWALLQFGPAAEAIGSTRSQAGTSLSEGLDIRWAGSDGHEAFWSSLFFRQTGLPETLAIMIVVGLKFEYGQSF